MTFKLFSSMLRGFLGTIIRLNRTGTIGFFLPQLDARLNNLSDVFESCCDEWTLDERMRAKAVLDEFALRMEIQNDYWEYQSSSELCGEECGSYCVN